MNDRDLLVAIARVLNGVDADSLSVEESQIANLLIENEILMWNEAEELEMFADE